MKPAESEHPAYMTNYIKLVKEDDLILALEASGKKALDLFATIPPEKTNLVYAPGKWSVKELLVHLIDTERVFSYRAMSFARGETQLLPSFDENDYAANSEAARMAFSDIVEGFRAMRHSNLLLFKSFSEENLRIIGKIPAGPISVNALGFSICGHTLHHLGVLRERYLN